MTLTTAINSAASGDNIIGHTVTAATLGGGASSTLVWAIETFAHVTPPDSVAQWFTAVCMVIASYVMQRLSN